MPNQFWPWVTQSTLQKLSCIWSIIMPLTEETKLKIYWQWPISPIASQPRTITARPASTGRLCSWELVPSIREISPKPNRFYLIFADWAKTKIRIRSILGSSWLNSKRQIEILFAIRCCHTISISILIWLKLFSSSLRWCSKCPTPSQKETGFLPRPLRDCFMNMKDR